MKCEWMYYDGENTEEVVDFCSKWQYSLCSIYGTYTNKITGKNTLKIEPSDTMRESCFNVALGDLVIRGYSTDGKEEIMKTRPLTKEEIETKSKIEKHYASDGSSELRMEGRNVLNLYQTTFDEEGYKYVAGSKDYEVDNTKNFHECLLEIEKDIEENGCRMEW